MQATEIQDRYIHWRTLEVHTTRQHGANDDLARFYRNKREQTETLAEHYGVSVSHLARFNA